MKKIKSMLIVLLSMALLSISFTACSNSSDDEDDGYSKITASDVRNQLLSDIHLNDKSEENEITINKKITNDDELVEAALKAREYIEVFIKYGEINSNTKDFKKVELSDYVNGKKNQFATFVNDIMENVMGDEQFMKDCSLYMEDGTNPTKDKSISETIDYKDLKVSEGIGLIYDTLCEMGLKDYSEFTIPSFYDSNKELIDNYANINKLYLKVNGDYKAATGNVSTNVDFASAFEVSDITSLINELGITCSIDDFTVENFPVKYFSLSSGIMMNMDSTADKMYNPKTPKDCVNDVNYALVFETKFNLENKDSYSGYFDVTAAFELDKDLYEELVSTSNSEEAQALLYDNLKINIKVSDNKKVTYNKDFNIEDLIALFD